MSAQPGTCIYQMLTGIGSIKGAGATTMRCTFCGITTIRNGSDASSATAEISSIIGCHRPGRLLMLQILQHDIRPSSAQHIQHLATIDVLVRDHDQSLVIAAHQPGEGTVRHCLQRRAVRSRTSLKPRRSRRTASDKPAGDGIGMMARLDVVADDHSRMPNHQPRIIARRHQEASRLIGTSMANRTHNAAVGEQSCSVRDGRREQYLHFSEDIDDLLLSGVCHLPFRVAWSCRLFMWRGVLSRDFKEYAGDCVADGRCRHGRRRNGGATGNTRLLIGQNVARRAK